AARSCSQSAGCCGRSGLARERTSAPDAASSGAPWARAETSAWTSASNAPSGQPGASRRLNSRVNQSVSDASFRSVPVWMPRLRTSSATTRVPLPPTPPIATGASIPLPGTSPIVPSSADLVGQHPGGLAVDRDLDPVLARKQPVGLAQADHRAAVHALGDAHAVVAEHFAVG